ncbi:MAG: MFS transporter [Geminicoccaceae bacterium]|nr:MFS transporter [Geminicoccaceae bacterium]
MTPLVATFATLFTAGGLLLAGNGLLGTLVAVRANLEGYAPTTIGLLGSLFYAGFILGAFAAPRWIGRAGHARAFAAFAALFAAAALVHALGTWPPSWMALRALSGFCFAGLTLVIESWLNERAANANRGRILGFYRLVDLGSVTLGQFVLTLADPRSFVLFSVVALLACLCLVPVSLTRVPSPVPLTTPRLRLWRLWEVSPLGTTGVFAVGLVNATFRLLGPVVGQEAGLKVAGVAAFISAFILGGALLQLPLGAASDRHGRRPVMVLLNLAAIAAGLGMSLAFGRSPAVLVAATFLFGGCAVPLYSLAVAHANDHAKADEFVEIGAGLFLVFGIGATLGPFLGSAAVALLGPKALFWYTSAVHASLLLFALHRARIRPTKKPGRRFVGLLRTSTALFRLADRD